MGGGVWVCVEAREQQQQQQALCVPFICGWGGASVGSGACLGVRGCVFGRGARFEEEEEREEVEGGFFH